jgi:excisionase family DNA binding protein
MVDELLNDVAGTAKALKVSEATVWRGLKSGTIPCVRVGSRVLIPTAWIKSLAESAGTWQSSWED